MKSVSIIIPIYNEEKNIPLLYSELSRVLAAEKNYIFEIIFVNDGSADESHREIQKIIALDQKVKYIDFSRNFGKEIATTAGINHCRGDACFMMDADLQHPPAMIPEFLRRWEKGAEVIIGVRKKNSGEGLAKKLGSYFFYKIINKISETKILPNATDFRLLDRAVINEFNRFTERSRMTRALIAWLGFRREIIYFNAGRRINGKAGYNLIKLVRLAFHSMVSLSLLPLKFAGYLGFLITVISGGLGTFIFIEKYILNDSRGYHFSGSAILAVIILFLVGIILICLGLIALYIANIHGEVINRPIYIIRKKNI